MTRIKRCKICGIYTLKEKCPKCGNPTSPIAPPKFSPEDKYGKYRRLLKKKYGVCTLRELEQIKVKITVPDSNQSISSESSSG